MTKFPLNFLATIAMMSTNPGDIKVLRLNLSAYDGDGGIQVKTFDDDKGDNEIGQVGDNEIVLKTYHKTDDGAYLTICVDQKLLESGKRDIGNAATGMQLLFNFKGIKAVAGLHDDKAPTVTFYITQSGEKVKATQIVGVKDTFVVKGALYGLTNEGLYLLKGDKVGEQMTVIANPTMKPNYGDITSVSRLIDGPSNGENLFLNRGCRKTPLVGMIQGGPQGGFELIVWGEAAISGTVFGGTIDGSTIVVQGGGVMELDHGSFLAAAYTPQQQAPAG